MCLTPVFSGVHVTRSLVLCVMFCRSLFVFLYFFFWPLRCLFFFDIRILITSLWYLQTLHNLRELTLRCLMQFSTLFQLPRYIVEVSFIGGENRSTRRKPTALLLPKLHSPGRFKLNTIEFGFVAFFTKNAAIRRKSNDWLARNQSNVSDWSDTSTRGLLFQWASTIQIQLSVSPPMCDLFQTEKTYLGYMSQPEQKARLRIPDLENIFGPVFSNSLK
jgi:hypothetical protein